MSTAVEMVSPILLVLGSGGLLLAAGAVIAHRNFEHRRARDEEEGQ